MSEELAETGPEPVGAKAKPSVTPTVFPLTVNVERKDGTKATVPFVSVRFNDPTAWEKVHDTQLTAEHVLDFTNSSDEFNDKGIQMTYDRPKGTGEKYHMYLLRTASFNMVLDTETMSLGIYLRAKAPFAKLHKDHLKNAQGEDRSSEGDLLYIVPFWCWMFVRLTAVAYGMLEPLDVVAYGRTSKLVLRVADEPYEVTGFFNLKTEYPDFKRKKLLNMFRKMHYAYVKHAIGVPAKYRFKQHFELYLMHALEIGRPDYKLETVVDAPSTIAVVPGVSPPRQSAPALLPVLVPVPVPVPVPRPMLAPPSRAPPSPPRASRLEPPSRKPPPPPASPAGAAASAPSRGAVQYGPKKGTALPPEFESPTVSVRVKAIEARVTPVRANPKPGQPSPVTPYSPGITDETLVMERTFDTETEETLVTEAEEERPWFEPSEYTVIFNEYYDDPDDFIVYDYDPDDENDPFDPATRLALEKVKEGLRGRPAR